MTRPAGRRRDLRVFETIPPSIYRLAATADACWPHTDPQPARLRGTMTLTVMTGPIDGLAGVSDARCSRRVDRVITPRCPYVACDDLCDLIARTPRLAPPRSFCQSFSVFALLPLRVGIVVSSPVGGEPPRFLHVLAHGARVAIRRRWSPPARVVLVRKSRTSLCEQTAS